MAERTPTPQRRVWAFLRRLVVRYDAAVFSLPAFAQQLPIPQFLRAEHPPAHAEDGRAAREHVRQNFLITRHLRDYLSLLAHLSR